MLQSSEASTLRVNARNGERFRKFGGYRPNSFSMSAWRDRPWCAATSERIAASVPTRR